MNLINKDLNFKSMVALQEGIERTAKWIISQNLDYTSAYEESLAILNKKGLFK